MLEETLILDCNKRINRVLRDILDIHPDTACFTAYLLHKHIFADAVLGIDETGV